MAVSGTTWKGSPASLSSATYYDEYLSSHHGSRNVPQQQAGGDAPLLQYDRGSTAPYKGLDLTCAQSLALLICILVIMPLVKFSIVCAPLWVFYKLLVVFGWGWAIAPDQLKFGTLIFLPACFLSFCTGHIILIPIFKRLVMPGGLSVGQVPLASWEFIRLWLGMNILRLTAPIDDFLYGTMMIPIWIKLLGGNIPMNAECAAHLNTLTFVPELVDFKNESFVASHVDVGTMLVTKGKVILSQVKPEIHLACLDCGFQVTLGERCMLGNHSWLSPGANIGASALIGAYTVNPSMKVADGSTWFGAPAIELPKRFVDDSSADAYNPSSGQYLQRAVTEFFNAITDAFLMTGVWFYCHHK